MKYFKGCSYYGGKYEEQNFENNYGKVGERLHYSYLSGRTTSENRSCRSDKIVLATFPDNFVEDKEYGG